MDPTGIYSAAKAASGANFVALIRQPPTILRLFGILFSIIVFGCIASGCRTAHRVCIYRGENSACSFPIAVGVFAFLGALGLLVADGMFESISNLKKRRYIVVGDLAFSGLWTFLWFVVFCLLTNKWTTTEKKWLDHQKVENWQENNARAAIAFSLFAIGVWAGSTFFALQRFRAGQAGLGGQGDVSPDQAPTDNAGVSASGYGGLPDQTGQQPFATGGAQASTGPGQYYAPTY